MGNVTLSLRNTHFNSSESAVFQLNASVTHRFKKSVSRVGSVFFDYLKRAEGLKAVFKTTYYSVDWYKKVKPVPLAVQNLRNLASDGKNAISVTEIPSKTNVILQKLVKMSKERSLNSFKELISAVAELTGPVSDAIKLGTDKKIIFVKPETLRAVGIISNGGLALGTTIGGYNEANQMMTKVNQYQNTKNPHEANRIKKELIHSSININKFASYALLGSVGLASAAGCIVSGWIPLALGTSALAFTIGGHFYKELNHI